VRPLLALTAFLVLAIMAAPTARAAALPLDGTAQSISAGAQLVYAKYKGWKVKKVRRRGPPPWAPAHGLRWKRHW
jgi:hypothetical protein